MNPKSSHAEPSVPAEATGSGEPALRRADVEARVSALTGRRGVLRMAGAVAGAGVLAACSSPPVPPAEPSSSSAAAPPEGATSEGAAPAPGSTPTSDVPVGGGKIYPDIKTVVTQPEAGTFKAFDTTCPHQGCPVTSIVSKQIICPCHGSAFDISTGDRVAGPAPTGLTPKKVTVSGDALTVA